MSDNASSLISCMANGCITLTKQGGMTANEYRVSGPKEKPRPEYTRRYLGRVGIDEARYDPVTDTVKFSYMGAFKDAVVTLGQKNVEYTTDSVYEEIARREGDKSQAANRATLQAMIEALERHRAPRICRAHLDLYSELVPLTLLKFKKPT